MTDVKGIAVALTGAASGIGRALAEVLAKAGADLALADIAAADLAAVAGELRSRHNIAISTHVVDVAKGAEIERYAQEAIARHPRLAVLVNNAGVALQGRFDEMELADLEWVMSINFMGVVHGCHAFLPHLKRQPAAHIVNLSSIFGMVAPAGQTAYSASKFAVRGFTESLRHELAGGTVRVTSVHPGGIATPIARHARVASHADPAGKAALEARFATMARTSPEVAAVRICAGIQRNEARVLIGNDARIVDILQRLMPVRYAPLMQRVFARGAAPVVAAAPAAKPPGGRRGTDPSGPNEASHGRGGGEPPAAR